jgi:hypothetical protein
MKVIEGRPVVDEVYVNGHGPFRFLVDTGSNVNLIETGLARKIGMKAMFQVELASSAGKILTEGSDGNELLFDATMDHDQKFLFTNLEEVHALDPDIRGVVGQWFLSRFDYTIDLRAKRFEFGKQDREGARVRFMMLNGRLVVPTSLGDLVLDSGTARVMLFGGGAVDRNENRGMVKTFAGSQTIGITPRKLTIEGRDVWHGDAVRLPSHTEPGVGGLLPISLFKAVYVANSEGYLVLE